MAELLLALILLACVLGAVVYGVCWVGYWATVGATWLAHRGAMLIERGIDRIRDRRTELAPVYSLPPREPAPDAPWLPYVEPEPTLIGPFGGKHPPLPPDAPRWRRAMRGTFRFFNEAAYTLIGGR